MVCHRMLGVAAFMLVLIGSVSATCRDVVCPRLTEFEESTCTQCEKAFKVANADPENGVCCKEFRCKPDPEQPCCGVTDSDCPFNNNQTLATEACNSFTGNAVRDSLNPAFGTFTATLVRPARRSRGKCCNKYACTQNAEALCAARIAKEPCNDVCPACYRRVVVTRANPSNGVDCCPVIRCVYNPRDCCNMRDNKACPQPTCDSDLENAVQYAPVVAPQLNCCPRLRCEADAAAVCARRVELDPLGPNTACGACELPAMTREADPANGRCWDRFECLPSPDRCCGFNSSTCPAAPDCGPFADAFVSRPVDAYAGQCCPTYSCANNNTLICDAFTCEYESAEAYMAERCPNPPGRDWYFVEIKRPADVASGICCPKYKCRETTEKKLYDVEQNLSGRRRRRRRAAATTAAPVTTV